MKYLKKFENHTAYETYINGSDVALPNVSLCVQEGEVYYNPIEIYVTNVFDVVDSSLPTQIMNTYALTNNYFTSIVIDGVKQNTIQNTYEMSVGEHTVKYAMADPTTLGSGAFAGSMLLKTTNIPETVLSIESGVYNNCTGLTSLTIPDNVTEIKNSAFSQCSNIETLTIGSGVTSINSSAFSDCTNIAHIVFNAPIPLSPSVVLRSSLQECIIGDLTPSISDGAFNGISNLTTVTIGNGVTTIGNSAFYYCIGLSSIIIPSGVTSIGGGAFYGCTSLSSVTILATTPPTHVGGCFQNNASGRKIYVPAESVNTYKTASGWSDYAADIEAIPTT